MKTMSDNINFEDTDCSCKSMSGNIRMENCNGDAETMSGNITFIRGQADLIKSMSGMIYLDDVKSKTVSTMSGNITGQNIDIKKAQSYSGDILLSGGVCDYARTVTGLLSLRYMNLYQAEATNISIKETSIHKLILHGKRKTKRKWWNPFTWENSSINIQCSGDLILDNDIKINGKSLEDIDKESEPVEFHIPKGCFIDIIELKSGGKVYSSYDLEVIGGELVII